MLCGVIHKLGEYTSQVMNLHVGIFFFWFLPTFTLYAWLQELCPKMGHFFTTWSYFLCDFANLGAKSTNF